jgi:hypothetical protein
MREASNLGASHTRLHASPAAGIAADLAKGARLRPTLHRIRLGRALGLSVLDLARAPKAPDGSARVDRKVTIILGLADGLVVFDLAHLVVAAVVAVARILGADSLAINNLARAERALGDGARVEGLLGLAGRLAVAHFADLVLAAVVALARVFMIVVVVVVVVVIVVVIVIVVVVVIVITLLGLADWLAIGQLADFALAAVVILARVDVVTVIAVAMVILLGLANTLAVNDLADLVVAAVDLLAWVLGRAAAVGLGRRHGDEDGEEGSGEAHFDFFVVFDKTNDWFKRVTLVREQSLSLTVGIRKPSRRI